MRSSATARAESCAASWTPACAILMICFAIISVRGSSRSLTQRVCNACSYASLMRLISPAPRQSSLIGDRSPFLIELILVPVARGRPLRHMRSCLGSAGFANQEVALNARRGTLSLLA